MLRPTINNARHVVMQELISLVANRPDFWMSLIVILIMLGMGVYFLMFMFRNIRDDAAKAEQERSGAK